MSLHMIAQCWGRGSSPSICITRLTNGLSRSAMPSTELVFCFSVLSFIWIFVSKDFTSSTLFSIMGKFLSISSHDSLSLFQLTPETEGPAVLHGSVSLGDKTLSGRKKSEHLLHLSKLLNQLQVRFFAWASQELSKPQEATDDVDKMEKLIIHCELLSFSFCSVRR